MTTTCCLCENVFWRVEADAQLPGLYEQMRRRGRVCETMKRILWSASCLSGIVQVVQDIGEEPIYFQVFDRDWVVAEHAGCGIERQRAAFRRQAIQTMAVALLIIAAFAFLLSLMYALRVAGGNTPTKKLADERNAKPRLTARERQAGWKCKGLRNCSGR
jgi:hypothetical protein